MQPRFSQLCVLLLLGPFVLSSHGQSSKTDSQASNPVFKTNAQAVIVDVVVTKGNDESVLALHEQDFEVLEDGKPQKIDLFEEHSASRAVQVALPSLPPHVYTNLPSVPASTAINILLLDNLNTPGEDQAYVRGQIANYLQSKDPATQIAIFTLNSKLHLLQSFTADTSLLKAALDSKAAQPGTTVASHNRNDDLRDKEDLSKIAEMSNTGGADAELPYKSISDSLANQASNQAGQRTATTLAALQQLARAMEAIPGRKNLLWFARTFPVSIFPDGPTKQTLNNGKEIGDVVRVTAGLLTQAKVAVYPVSAQGILVDRTTNADSGGQPEGDNFERDPLQETNSLNANHAAMMQLATDTGGQALYTSNDLGKAIANAIENGSHYYTIVYTPSEKKLDGKFHKIEIRLIASKANLSYRRGYFAANASDAKPTTDPLPSMMAFGMPASTQIVYEARLLPLSPQPAIDAPRAGGNLKLTGSLIRYKVDFGINPSNISLDLAADGNRTGKIEVALIAFDHDGHPLNWTGNTLALNLSPAAYAQVQRQGIPLHLQLDLPNADATVSTGVYDLSARTAGTLEIPLHPSAGSTIP